MRDEASAGLDFEGAAALHARLEKVKAATAQLPEIVRRLDELNGVMIQPSAECGIGGAVQDWSGRICEPVRLDVESSGGRRTCRPSRSRWRRASPKRCRECASAKHRSALEWMEHLALLKRWYYRTVKDR